ncbi:unnamed protein product [Heligmosomoides polygyrus]|uniref:DUF1907 domain-containing protein n=1 Tax=Heligmosomoides polygyrus TaxID=6339 RepID=A0A183FJK9_HELPZ|nr:unnamed protein product [Heligmosomoides polygyrus]
MSRWTYVINTLKPSNNELRSVIETALWKNFKNVQVAVSNSPDLSKPPFRMTSNGFGKKLTIAEVGGMGNLFPVLRKEEYDIREICSLCDKKSAFVFGPGACPKSVMGTTGELVADVNLSTNKARCQSPSISHGMAARAVASKVTTIVNDECLPYKTTAIDSTKFSLMANLAISEEPGPAEVVRATFLVAPPTVSRAHTCSCVSLAGIFLLLRGQASAHIVPDFPTGNFKSIEEEEQWLRKFTLKAPLVCTSVFHSYDAGHRLRMVHTHCYSDHNDAGHFYTDITPESAVYEGWFTAAEQVYRIDKV